MIDGSGNTRMIAASRERDRVSGQLKGIKPYETAFALYGAGLTRDNAAALEGAERIMETAKGGVS